MKRQKHGHIVNICSSAGHCYSCDASDYCGSKAALFYSHAAIRTELKRDKANIDTTIACPSGIETGMFKGFITNEWIKPIFPWYKPEEAAGKIYDAIIKKDESI